MQKTFNKADKIYVGHINIRQSIFFLMLKLIILDVMAAFLAIVYFIFASNKLTLDVAGNIISSHGLTFFLTLFIAKITLSIYAILEWINEYYEIWPNLVIHKRGFIFKHEERHPYTHIKSIKVEQGFLGKNFGFGTITFYDWYLEKYTFLYLIHNPLKYFNIIENLIPRTEEEKLLFQEKEE